MEYRFSLECIERSGALSSGRMSWEAIREARELRRSFLLFTSANQVNIIPKHFFRDAEAVKGFRGLLQQVLGERAKL